MNNWFNKLKIKYFLWKVVRATSMLKTFCKKIGDEIVFSESSYHFTDSETIIVSNGSWVDITFNPDGTFNVKNSKEDLGTFNWCQSIMKDIGKQFELSWSFFLDSETDEDNAFKVYEGYEGDLGKEATFRLQRTSFGGTTEKTVQFRFTHKYCSNITKTYKVKIELYWGP